MKIQLKENNFSIKIKKDVSNTEEPNFVRPNIDHLIKRILTERRKQERKNLTVFMGILLIIGCTIMFSYYS
jgi:hypothetical protein